MKLTEEEFNLRKEACESLFSGLQDLVNDIKMLKKNPVLHPQNLQWISLPALYSIIEYLAKRSYSHEHSSKKRFKKTLLEMANQKEDLEKIDIVYLYQWNYDDHATNLSDSVQKKLKQLIPIHLDIRVELEGKFPSDNINIYMDSNKRFQNLQDVIDLLSVNKKLEKNKEFLQEILCYFTKVEVIYRFGRCTAVHEGDMSPRKFITTEYLIKLVNEIIINCKNAYIKDLEEGK